MTAGWDLLEACCVLEQGIVPPVLSGGDHDLLFVVDGDAGLGWIGARRCLYRSRCGLRTASVSNWVRKPRTGAGCVGPAVERLASRTPSATISVGEGSGRLHHPKNTLVTSIFRSSYLTAIRPPGEGMAAPGVVTSAEARGRILQQGLLVTGLTQRKLADRIETDQQ